MVSTQYHTPPVSPSRHIVPASNKRAYMLPQSTSHLRRRRANTMKVMTVPSAALPDPFGPRGFTNARAVCKYCSEVYRPEFSPCAPHCSIDCRTMDKLWGWHLKQRGGGADEVDTEGGVGGNENENAAGNPGPVHRHGQAPEADQHLPSPPPPPHAHSSIKSLDVNRPRTQSAPPASIDAQAPHPTSTNLTADPGAQPAPAPQHKQSALYRMLSLDDSRRQLTEVSIGPGQGVVPPSLAPPGMPFNSHGVPAVGLTSTNLTAVGDKATGL